MGMAHGQENYVGAALDWSGLNSFRVTTLHLGRSSAPFSRQITEAQTPLFLLWASAFTSLCSPLPPQCKAGQHTVSPPPRF